MDLFSMVHLLLLSMGETDLHSVKPGPYNANCIRYSLVKLLGLSRYDDDICVSRWQCSGKVPGGDHQYIDVVNYNNGNYERVIIDIDFRSHFKIARPVDPYDRILHSLPVVYVGSLTQFKQLLQLMVEAARSSLKQNSMLFPSWRSLAYLQAKWYSDTTLASILLLAIKPEPAIPAPIEEVSNEGEVDAEGVADQPVEEDV
ncbi:hypothetical protein Gohar_009095 [Gossypium harknessii]|uniref:Uncharacterized protein n=1 Tax=Gossypium harknessii TaxID=34285 RepID=A0A7J9GLR3_9ROSI|nr:hypothetical protein [Gossypium harknessii]